MSKAPSFTAAEMMERYPEMTRLLEQVGLDNGVEINPAYTFTQDGISGAFDKAERFAATIDWDDMDVVEAIVTVDCDEYDDLVMSDKDGQVADRIISDLFDGKGGKDENGQPFFVPCYSRWLRTTG